MNARPSFFQVALAVVALGLGWVTPSSAQYHPSTEAQRPKVEPPAKPQEPAVDHSQHQTTAQDRQPPASPITDEDRAAAFPDVQGHAVHDNVMNYFVLFDQLEWQSGGENGLNWDNKGWIGRDIDRLWFRSEVQSEDGRVEDAEAHILYGRAFSRWWELVGGVRQDFRPGPARTWAAIGIQGLAPYWFEVEVTAYVGAAGRAALRLETEYELLLTNRLILQPLVEMNFHSKSDPERGTGAGLSTLDTGFRLRYEVRREVAPYIGITWNRKFGKTADLAETAGEDIGGARVVLGARVWF